MIINPSIIEGFFYYLIKRYFMNYQLCRTNVKLGGQMKLDLILGKRGNDLVIKDFNLSPISNLIPYNHNNENILGNTHQTNINEFYKKIAGDFYKDKINPILESKYPVESNDPIYDDTFIMGCKRMGFDRYNTQFEFFCPLWIDNYDNGNPLVFRLDLYLKDGTTLIDSKKIILDKCGDKFHDKFIDYINSYFESIDFQSPMNINLGKRNAYVWGLNIDSMKIERRDIDLVDDMLSRERPLMETDYMIISSFEKHNIIVPQLFNFNLCFNIGDFLNVFNKNELIGENIKVKMRVFQGENELELRDFYSNYNYIPKTLIDYDGKLTLTKDTEHIIPNVLDYLYDDKYQDFVYTNKIVQSIIHWSLDGNNEYIFNVYDGFGGYMIDENKKYRFISNKYANSPSILNNAYSKSSNNAAWAKLYKIDIKSPSYIKAFVKNLKSKGFTYSTFSRDMPWVNNIRYKYPEDWDKILKVIILHDNTKELKNYQNEVFEGYTIIEYEDFNIAYEDNNGEKFIVVYSDDIKFLTYGNVIKKIEDSNDEVIKNLYTILSNVDIESQNMIPIGSSLTPVLEFSPSPRSREIVYLKNNFNGTLLSRYSGPINPTFIKMDDDKWYNEFYYKKTSLEPNSNYYESGFDPNYPSIGYYSLNKTKQKYNEFDNNLDYINEYKWFNDNLIFILDPEINVELKSKHNNEVYVKVNDLVNEYIAEYYKKVGSNNDIINHILSLYEYESSYEYGYEEDGKTIKVDSENMAEYIYKVKIKLK